MSRRPVGRIVARHKQTKEYTDIGAMWPPPENFQSESGFPYTLTYGSKSRNSPLSIEDALAIVASGDYWIDIRENEPSKEDW